MTWLRHSTRHVHATVAGWIEDQLEDLGWLDDSNTPFGAPKLTIRRTPAMLGGVLPTQTAAGLVTVTIGDEPGTEPEELGGPLTRTDIPLFVDIFMDREAHGQAVAEDVRDILMGRIGALRVMPVTDQITGTPRTDWSIHFDDIEIVRPEVALALTWHVVKVTCEVYFNEEIYG